jgi:multicomponent K+:H+ antiporter subunit C
MVFQASFGMTAVVVMIALGAYLGSNNDNVDDPVSAQKIDVEELE